MTMEAEELLPSDQRVMNPLRSDCWYGLPLPHFGAPPNHNMTEDERAAALQAAFRSHLRYTLAKYLPVATGRNYYHALVYTLRDYLTDAWLKTQQDHYERNVKRVYYLSAEYMIGRHLDTVLVNLQLEDTCRRALQDLALDLDEIVTLEWDAGLGAGGLGRLAACFLDSMATCAIPSFGYGIRYEYGIFFQKIEDGRQVETPDNWLRYGNPWEVARPEYIYPVRFYGHVRRHRDETGKEKVVLENSDLVMAMAYDIPIPGYGNGVVNTLRLWAAKSSREFDLEYFNHGDYSRAVEDKTKSESISRVLYPRDDIFQGRELRLKQEYFLVSASMQDIVRRYKKSQSTFDSFPQKVAVQLNDTHPALAVPELMRILLDDEGLDWNAAWSITRETFGFTNHTLMPEALERWPVTLIGHVLPRILQIIYDINHRFLGEVAHRFPGDLDRLRRMSFIEEHDEKRVRMANLAIAGSRCVNGVSALHTELFCRHIVPDFHDMFPERFSNKTNGITPRLWLRKANPRLADLITSKIGTGWITQLQELERLVPLANDPDFRTAWKAVKYQNKVRLSRFLEGHQNITVPPNSLFDCQIKRIHEYKRQVLNLLHVIVLYNRIKDGIAPKVPRTIIFAGKASPAYWMAKTIIHLINAVANVINGDKHANEHLTVVFIPNYSVSLAEVIIPATELSEQISTAGTEASGTSNMKMALNGALTIGTLDGANIEIREAVGPENYFLFGRNAAEVEALKKTGYNTIDYYYENSELGRALNMIRDGYFSPEHRDMFQPITETLLRIGDPFFVLPDFASYMACQQEVDNTYLDHETWTRRSILNTARVGRFSSDNTIRAYAKEIWRVPVADADPSHR